MKNLLAPRFPHTLTFQGLFPPSSGCLRQIARQLHTVLVHGNGERGRGGRIGVVGDAGNNIAVRRQGDCAQGNTTRWTDNGLTVGGSGWLQVFWGLGDHIEVVLNILKWKICWKKIFYSIKTINSQNIIFAFNFSANQKEIPTGWTRSSSSDLRFLLRMVGTLLPPKLRRFSAPRLARLPVILNKIQNLLCSSILLKISRIKKY